MTTAGRSESDVISRSEREQGSKPPGAPPFLDTNILLRFVLDDVPDQSARTQALFANIARGSASYQTCGTVIFECVYVLQSHYAVPRVRIREALLPILQLEHLLLPHGTIYPDVFDIYVSHRSLSFADCYHAVLSRHLGCPAIISFDRGLDKIPDLVRTKPPLPPRPT